MKEKWNERYTQTALVYGAEPNEFVKQILPTLAPGKIFFPGEGEGRNAIFAAQNGWQVDACDYSDVACQKARQRAQTLGLALNYFVADVTQFDIEPETYDAIVLIYLHLPQANRTAVHQKLVAGLKPGGVLLAETFSKAQINNNSGGPKNLDLLYEMTALAQDFRMLEMKMLEQRDITLNEGILHQGLANVIRLIGVKPLAETIVY